MRVEERKKTKIKILRLIESVRYTTNDIYKVADEIMEIQKAYADEVKVNFANDVMNRAYGKNGIKGIPHSNKIAEFINQTLKQIER